MELKTQPNERRCSYSYEEHELPLAPACPVSGNPQAGSKLTIRYKPDQHFLEVEALRAYVDSYTGGRGDVRSMEGMIQQICTDCAKALGVRVEVEADLVIRPRQRMLFACAHVP
jgi:NADPH-dependent 7-cyano-7-deazaguanine reductase QueF